MHIKNIIIILLVLFFASCKYDAKNGLKNKASYFCNTEVFNDENKLCDFDNTNLVFAGKNLKSKDESFSGKTSLKLNAKQKFAFSFDIPNVIPEQYYEVTIMIKGDTKSIALVAQGSKNFYKKSQVVIKKNIKGWSLMKLNFFIPPTFNNNDKIKVYVWNVGGKTVYVDDFKVSILPNEVQHIYKEKPLRIYIEDGELEKLKKIRQKAFKKRILETTKDSWVKAVLFYGDETYKAKLRFKGDWLDHLQGIKWSFRIKLKKNGSFKGMREFSIQTPAARYFIDEWLVHKIYEKEDVLTTRYDFIPVYLNGKNLGLYVYEEHFVKQLIENKKRREGPIIKFTEDQMWKARVYKDDKQYPVFLSSEIVPFKSSKIEHNKKLKKQFELAQNLLYKYKFFTNNAESVFDIDKLAKYLALIDLTRSYHGLIWHNQRFYYNPVLSKLEPIAYDNYCDAGVMQWTERAIYGNINTSKLGTEPNGFNNFLYLFRNKDFVDKYTYYLKKYSSEEYVNTINKDFDKEIKYLKKILKFEFPAYNYNSNFLIHNAKEINIEMPEFIKKSDSNLNIRYTKPIFKHIKKYNPKYIKEIVPYYVKAWKSDNKIKVINYYPKDIILLGLSNNTNIISYPFSENINMEYFNNTYLTTEDAVIKYLALKVSGKEDILYVKVTNYKYPKKFYPAEELVKSSNIYENTNFSINKNNILFKTGNIVIEKPIVIPKGYKVIFKKGTKVDFINSSMFISYSPIFMDGSENDKIIIKSSDGTARGFSVIQANEKSKLNNVVFDNFNTLEYKGWELSGAINFYESDVEINSVTFKNNLCEDALNIVRSNFNVSNCNFNHIFSDAFDSDFCTGNLLNTNFNNVGNDAIDFSGSVVYISNCEMNDIGDKGVSGGENSTLDVEDCNVSKAQIGFASKDKSKVKLKNCDIKDCRYGLVALQKKPEYDFAEIDAENITWDNIIDLYAIEKKSKLTLNNKKIKGNIKNLAKRFY